MALLLLIADQKGFFHDHGVEIEYVTVPYARKGMEMMIAGEVDATTMVETNFAYLGYLKPKTPFKGFVSIEKRTSDHFMMRGADQKVEDILGKTVAFTPRTTSHTFLIHFMKQNGLQRNDIKLKVMSPQAMPNALIRGEIDAMSLWQPYVNNTMISMDELGLPYTHFRNDGGHLSQVSIVASKSFLVKNRTLVSGILKGLKNAEEFFKEEPDRAYEVLAQAMRISGRWHKKVIGEYRAELSIIGESYLKNIYALSDWIRENDTEFLAKEEPNYLDYIDNSYFLDVFPEK